MSKGADNSASSAAVSSEESKDNEARVSEPATGTKRRRDVAPEGDNYLETKRNFDHIVKLLHDNMSKSGIKLLWGTANAFSHKRYMAGASTNPDPEIFAYVAAQVKNCMDITHRLGGENYVLWGGREGYETILNTNMKIEMEKILKKSQKILFLK